MKSVTVLLLVATMAALLSADTVSGSRLGLREIWADRRSTYCRSQLMAARQALQDCLSNRCSVNVVDSRLKRISCRIGCFHRFLLTEPAKADAYDKLVEQAGCNADGKSLGEIRTCRRQAFDTESTAQPVLDQLQQYNVLVCEMQCPASQSKDICTANCRLSQLLTPDAYKKFTDCMTQRSCAQKEADSREFDDCKEECLTEC